MPNISFGHLLSYVHPLPLETHPIIGLETFVIEDTLFPIRKILMHKYKLK